MKNRNSNEFSISNIDEINDSGCKEFKVGEGDWPFHGFLVKYGKNILVGYNVTIGSNCLIGHNTIIEKNVSIGNNCSIGSNTVIRNTIINWSPDNFLTPDKKKIICSSHGAIFDIESGLCVSGPCVGSKLLKLECFINNERVIIKLP